MKVFDLDFTDGKRCRCIVMEPLDDEDADKKGVQSIFHPGYVTGMRRIIAPPPEKLPWKRSEDTGKSANSSCASARQIQMDHRFGVLIIQE